MWNMAFSFAIIDRVIFCKRMLPANRLIGYPLWDDCEIKSHKATKTQRTAELIWFNKTIMSKVFKEGARKYKKITRS